MNNRQILGQHIKRTRKKKGWTLTHLQDKTGIAFQTLSSIEMGKINTGIDTIFVILEALKADFHIENGKII